MADHLVAEAANLETIAALRAENRALRFHLHSTVIGARCLERLYGTAHEIFTSMQRNAALMRTMPCVQGPQRAQLEAALLVVIAESAAIECPELEWPDMAEYPLPEPAP